MKTEVGGGVACALPLCLALFMISVPFDRLLFLWGQALEVASRPDLKEEHDANDDAHLIRTHYVGLAKQQA